MRISFKYLGLKVGENSRNKEFWKVVIDKIRKKLTK